MPRDFSDTSDTITAPRAGAMSNATRAPGTALEAVTGFDYDANGNLTEVTLPNGVTVTYTYDRFQTRTVQVMVGKTQKEMYGCPLGRQVHPELEPQGQRTADLTGTCRNLVVVMLIFALDKGFHRGK